MQATYLRISKKIKTTSLLKSAEIVAKFKSDTNIKVKIIKVSNSVKFLSFAVA